MGMQLEYGMEIQGSSSEIGYRTKAPCTRGMQDATFPMPV